MNRVLLITDKKRVSTDIALALHQERIIGTETRIDMVHTWGSSWWHYPIPSKIPRNSIPYVDLNLLSHREMKLKPYIADNIKKVVCFDRTIAGGLSRQSASDLGSTDDIMHAFAKRWSEYDRIFVCSYPSPNGWGGAMHFLRMIGLAFRDLSLPFSEFLQSPVRPLLLTSGGNPEDIIEAYRRNMDINSPEINELTNYYDSRQTFDFLWNCNSASLFSECLKLSGVDHPKIMTKYMLMALHILDKYQNSADVGKNRISTVEFHAGLLGWLGTGKYRIKSLNPVLNDVSKLFYNPLRQPACEDDQLESTYQKGVGSPMTIMPILENLEGLGLVTIKNDLIEVSDKGQSFLSRCHQNTFDPDLPFRLDVWCRAGDYEKMFTYLRTIFGRQKRFMNKLEPTIA